MTAVRVLGIELGTGKTPPGDLRTAAVDAARLIETALVFHAKGDARRFTEDELFSISLLADSIVSLLGAADEIERIKNHSCK